MKLIPVIALLFTTSALAQPCAKLDFAELDSLQKEELLQMRCEYFKQELKGYPRCGEEASRMDRIIARKYKLKNKGDEDLPYFVEVNAMCNKI